MLSRVKCFNEYCQTQWISENLKYHVDHNISLCESVFRPFSESHIDLLKEARVLYDQGQLKLDGIDRILFETTQIGIVEIVGDRQIPLDIVFESTTLNRPNRGGAKKYHVYVKNPKTGKIKKISFGDKHGGLTAKVSNPKARKSFAARHNCAEKKDRLTAGYWACRINRYAHLWGGKTYPGYW
jgi:hypothetical protein